MILHLPGGSTRLHVTVKSRVSICLTLVHFLFVTNATKVNLAQIQAILTLTLTTNIWYVAQMAILVQLMVMESITW